MNSSFTEGEMSGHYNSTAHESDVRNVVHTCDEAEETLSVDTSNSGYALDRTYETEFDSDSCSDGSSKLVVNAENPDDPGEFVDFTGDPNCLNDPSYSYIECSIGSYSGVLPVIKSNTEMEYTDSRPHSGNNDSSDPGPPPTSSHVDWNTTWDRIFTVTLSTEWVPEETAVLIERVLGELEGWDDAGGSCTAARFLSEDESSFSATKIRVRFEHAPTGTCYLKAWYKTIWTPAEGEPVEDTDFYEWSGSGSPCFTDPDSPATDEANRIEGEWVVFNVPEENGSLQVEFLKWSCVEGYEPEDGDPNGYPAA